MDRWMILVILTLMGCSRPVQQPSMTIRAVGSTSNTWYKPGPQPIWTFAITNTGSINVKWMARVELRGIPDKQYSMAGAFVDLPEGYLAPGQGLHTNMIVPALTGSMWRASIDYWPSNAGREMHTYKDGWH
jgi:hypothetical protein